MNVRELIEILEKHDQNLEVWVAANHEYAWALPPEEVWVGNPTPTWHRRETPDVHPFDAPPDRLVIGE